MMVLAKSFESGMHGISFVVIAQSPQSYTLGGGTRLLRF